ncbi:contactin-associated protein-like 4 isoform X2 [Syngnathoides biaculeatus]|uniref:contactin-associated protein-like 4 isoform X2 n=1 Tax=Syngnathoides biaculeatus TaxID=300417 RepID=UPI002ADE524D|nr:contactin-associated protein-like 4 isoform X2 [Syngnathoides biaculeatus]
MAFHSIFIVIRLDLVFSSPSGFLIHPKNMHDVCDSPLVSNLPHSSFQSSSQMSGSHGPVYAKVNRREGAGGWSPLISDIYQWLEVDLGRRTRIMAVATQGRYGSSDWLTAYLLMFSDTGHNWRQHRQEESFGALPGNSNADTVVHYKLEQTVVARFLRLIPLAWNPNGRIGLRLEIYGCHYASDVANFDGGSSVLYRPSVGSSPMSISLNLKTPMNFGILLHAGGKGEHSLTLALEKGKLLLFHQHGMTSSSGGHVLSTMGSLLDDQHWHHVKLERIDTHLNLTVDKNTQHVVIPADLSYWDIQWLSLGAVHSPERKSKPHKKNFNGCVENLHYNDLNLIDMAKKNNPQVTVVGNVTFSCAESISVAVTFTDSQSFLKLPGHTTKASGLVVIALQFRTWNEKGLLLTFNFLQQQRTLWLYLSDARLQLQINDTTRVLLKLNKGSGLNDGQWHSVELSCGQDQLSMAVDKEKGTTTHSAGIPQPDGQLFFGGCPPLSDNHKCKNPVTTFQGCMRLVTVNKHPVDFIKIHHRLLGNYSHLHIDMCGITDRCSPSYCEHGGTCTQSWHTFHCNCSNSGYRGATCHSSRYEQSCEAYKHKGKPSGHYYVDVDGSGPIKPHLMYCHMTDRAWMVIKHNNSELTPLHSSTERKQHTVHFHYASEEEHLALVLIQSEHCEQELSYFCRNSRLLNKADSTSLSWWFGGRAPGQIQTHWGGALPGSQQCACGLQNNCLNSSVQCNCDADSELWTNDSGLLTHKETLPVQSLVLGGIQPGSEASYKVGPLRCHGDTSCGVFLENLGIKDFIRIELRSPFEVIFSFDVGNGPLEVRVETNFSMNDNRWHSVRAERNVKEATLHVDDVQAKQEAPSDGQIHLQLNSQLFIGGTASRQKGFLGCIRFLQLNGITLDLDKRARITPGVQPGCPGHCNSYRFLCQNQGLCVEGHNGFYCDCSQSAYTGTFCHKVISAYFKSTTSIKYTLKEPYELNQNHSALPSSIFSKMTLRGENISLNFRTRQTPALLLFVNSFHREYIALLINRHGGLEVWYKLHNSRDVEVFKSSTSNLADGRLHVVAITRRGDSISIQIDKSNSEKFILTSDVEFNSLNSIFLGRAREADMIDMDLARLAILGFTGCLSAVDFNSITPLKEALLHPDSHVAITGPLTESNCGSLFSTNPQSPEATQSLPDPRPSLDPSQPLVNYIKSDTALIGGVIAVVIVIILSALAIITRITCSRNETYRNTDVKASQPDVVNDVHLSDEP